MFDIKKARHCAEYSHLAYMDDSVDGSYFISHRGTEVHVWVEEHTTVIAFRGTTVNWTDIRSDASFSCVPSPAGDCHKGFTRAWYVVHDLVMNIVDTTAPTNDIILTGHSLGGAIATRAALDFEPEKIRAIYTYGQPRVFLRRNKYPFNHLHYRVVNDADIVVKLPPLSFGYRHVGQCIFIDDKDTIRINPPWWFRFKEFAFAKVGRRVGDHKINDYIMALRASNVRP